MFKELEGINARPAPFQYYTAAELWTDGHTSQKMLEYHLNESIDVSSRNRKFIERSVSWMVSRFNVDQNTDIADFGCGPGLYAERLAERGASVTGIDFSENSLSYARQAAAEKGLNINYIRTNYLDFDTAGRFHLIIMIFCDFCVLSPEQRKIMLSKFNSLLAPGGSLLLDVYSFNTFNNKEETATYEKNQLNGFWSPDDYFGFLNTFKYKEEKLILDKYTIIDADRTRTVYNWQQCFSRDLLRKEFEENGLHIEEYYSDVAGTPFSAESDEFAVVARKT